MPDSQRSEYLRSIFVQLRWHVRPDRFALVRLDPRERLLALRLLPGTVGEFTQLITEPDMLTLVLPERDWRAMRPAFPRAQVLFPQRVISFDVDLPADLVGFLAAISAALAEADVSLLAICGYAKDHVVVREPDLAAACAAIERLVALHTAG